MWEWKIVRLALKTFIVGIAAIGCYGFCTERFVMGTVNLIALGLLVGFSPVGRWNNMWPSEIRRIFDPAKETHCPPGHSVCPECGKIEKVGEETTCH